VRNKVAEKGSQWAAGRVEEEGRRAPLFLLPEQQPTYRQPARAE
jgi:hypothetical protein